MLASMLTGLQLSVCEEIIKVENNISDLDDINDRLANAEKYVRQVESGHIRASGVTLGMVINQACLTGVISGFISIMIDIIARHHIQYDKALFCFMVSTILGAMIAFVAPHYNIIDVRYNACKEYIARSRECITNIEREYRKFCEDDLVIRIKNTFGDLYPYLSMEMLDILKEYHALEPDMYFSDLVDLYVFNHMNAEDREIVWIHPPYNKPIQINM